MDDAPVSIIEREKDNKIKKEDIAFKPKLGLVPDFDVPVFLPDLIGVADIVFNQQVLSIAPSSSIEMLIDLPDIVENSNIVQSNNQTVESYQKIPNTIPNNVSSFTSINENQIKNDAIFTENKDANEERHDKSEEPISIDDMSDIPTDDSRSSLLAQIRNFGGVEKLKDRKGIENRKSESKKKKQEEKETNLAFNMADQLKAALQDRRKYIAGSKSEVITMPKANEHASADLNLNNASLSDKISAMIPEPKEDNSSDSNSDWE